MSKRTTKHTIEERYDAVTKYLSGQCSRTAISKEYGIDKSTLLNWIRKYQANGMDGLKESQTWKRYSHSLKLNAVSDYLENSHSLRECCDKYNISSPEVLRQWVNLYTSGKSFKTTGGTKMKRGRKTTFKERLEIVQYTLANDKDYKKAIDKYKISYSQVYSWVRKFEKDGEAALQDNRGKTVKDREFETLSETERLKLEILRLKERNEYLETENVILKKLDEIERRRSI
ncbi:transposase [Ligilactobacillus murinus DSM 20452 = NBRC 14221]|uniref:Transposase n=1 Tax=Ligilactobacillus murinus DSM 20452 = NBRC 14221 TaxID=1423772 RepID=A0A0R2B238_9LACO|nr:transposase [Ligilactobacillus murinus DSM 20452 = NBRC 14221]